MKISPETFDDPSRASRLIEDQDAAFCARMTVCIESGLERAPIGIDTRPCTANPRLVHKISSPLANGSALGELVKGSDR